MKKNSLFVLALLAASQAAWSATTSQDAAARYAADKKLCAEETSSSLRMQCLRDAKAEYDQALSAAKSTATPTTRKSGVATCPDCGRVLDVKVVEKQGEGGALGIIGGGAAGALLGRQVGKGTGKDLATIAGAAAGAYGGHMAEEKLRSTRVWTVYVRLDSGDERSFEFAQDPGFAAGDAVRLSGNSIVHR